MLARSLQNHVKNNEQGCTLKYFRAPCVNFDSITSPRFNGLQICGIFTIRDLKSRVSQNVEDLGQSN